MFVTQANPTPSVFSKMHRRSCEKLLSAALLLTFSASQIISPSLAFATVPAFTAPSVSENLLEHISLTNLLIPPHLGTVTEVYNPTQKNSTDVILIADAHANVSAQKSIAELLNSFTQNQPANILLEGAAGIVDTSLLAYHPNVELRDRIAERLLLSIDINGAEFFSATHPEREITLRGLEDIRLYHRNLSSYQSVLRLQNDVLAKIHIFKSQLRSLENTLYPQETWKILQTIQTLLEKSPSDDLASLHEMLKHQSLVQISADYLPLLSEFITKGRTGAWDQTKSLDLMDEVKVLEKEIRAKLFINYDAETLYKLTNDLRLLEKAVNLEVVPEDLKYLKSNQEAFDWNHYHSFIERHRAESLSGTGWDKRRLTEAIFKFYAMAEKRDGVLGQHILSQRDSRMVTVALVGGFHIPGIANLLRSAGLSYATIIPNIEENSNKGHYQNRNRNAEILWSSKTLALACAFDLNPLLDPDTILRDRMLKPLITSDAAKTGEDFASAADRYVAHYKREVAQEVARRKLDPGLQNQITSRANRYFGMLTTHETPLADSKGNSGFGTHQQFQVGAFEISKLRQIVNEGGNNIVFLGGDSNIEETAIKPIWKAIDSNTIGLRGFHDIVVLDGEQDLSGSIRDRSGVWHSVRSSLMRTSGQVVIIKNFHRINENARAVRLLSRLLTGKGNILVGIAPAEKFHEIEAVWKDQPLTYSIRELPPDSDLYKNYRTKTALVFGASGHLGGDIFSELQSSGLNVVGTYFESAKRDPRWRKLDVRKDADVKRLVNEIKPDYIVYSAGVLVDEAQKDRSNALKIHASALNSFREYLDTNPNVRLVYISSDAVFPGNKGADESPYITSEPITSPPKEAGILQQYGLMKIIAERMVQSLTPNHLIVRSGFQLSARRSDVKPTAVTKIIDALDRKLVNGQKPIDLDTLRKRYPISTADVAHSIEKMLVHDLRGIYQLAGSTDLTEYELGVRIEHGYRAWLPFTVFEGASLENVFNPIEKRSAAPRASNAHMASSDLASPLDDTVQQLVDRLSRTKKGSGRSVTIHFPDEGRMLKLSKRNTRGMKKLQDEIRWLLRMAEFPEVRPHIAQVLFHDLGEESGIVRLETPDYADYSTLTQLILNKKISSAALREKIRKSYSFLTAEIHSKHFDTLDPQDVINIQHIKRLEDRIQEFVELASPDEHGQIEGFVKRETIVVNGKEYPNLPRQVERFKQLYQTDPVFRTIFTPPASAIGLIHGDPHMDNDLQGHKNADEFIWIDERGYFASDRAYDWAKLVHSIVGKYDFFNYRLFDAELLEEQGQLAGVRYAFHTNHRGFDRLRTLERELPEILDETLVPPAYRATDPYWFPRLMMTHAFHFAGIPPFQANPQHFKTAITVWGHAAVFFDQFFRFYDAWKSNDLKNFMDSEPDGRVIGYTYEDLRTRDFDTDGKVFRAQGFGAEQTNPRQRSDYVTDPTIQQFSIRHGLAPASVQRMVSQVQLDLDALAQSQNKKHTDSFLIITDIDQLPDSPEPILNNLDAHHRLILTFQGSREEAIRLFEDKYNIAFPEQSIDLIVYKNEAALAAQLNDYVLQQLNTGLKLENAVAYFRRDKAELLRKLFRRVLRVQASMGSNTAMEWEIILLLAGLGPNHSAVKPFIRQSAGSGIIRIAEIKEYLYAVMATQREIARAA